LAANAAEGLAGFFFRFTTTEQERRGRQKETGEKRGSRGKRGGGGGKKGKKEKRRASQVCYPTDSKKRKSKGRGENKRSHW